MLCEAIISLILTKRIEVLQNNKVRTQKIKQ